MDEFKPTIAFLLSAILMVLPVIWVPLFFDVDMGIIYTRTFEASVWKVQVLQTSLDSDFVFVAQTQSIWPMTTAAILTVFACLYGLFCHRLDHMRWCVYIAAVLDGVYLVLLVFYILRMTDKMAATVIPSWTALCPVLSFALFYWVISSFSTRRVDIEH